MYVTDSADHSISVLNKEGHLHRKTGRNQGDLHCPQAVCIDKNSALYISNQGGKILDIFDIIQED